MDPYRTLIDMLEEQDEFREEPSHQFSPASFEQEEPPVEAMPGDVPVSQSEEAMPEGVPVSQTEEAMPEQAGLDQPEEPWSQPADAEVPESGEWTHSESPVDGWTHSESPVDGTEELPDLRTISPESAPELEFPGWETSSAEPLEEFQRPNAALVDAMATPDWNEPAHVEEPQVQVIIPDDLPEEMARIATHEFSRELTNTVGQFQDLLREQLHMMDRRFQL